MNIQELKTAKYYNIYDRYHKYQLFAREAAKAWAVKKGLYHSVSDPEGLQEITPGLKAQQNSWATTEYFYSIEKDGRVHKMMHGQYEYLYGPADMGIIIFDAWMDFPNNFENDIEDVVLELLGVATPVYWNKDLIPELKAFVATFEC